MLDILIACSARPGRFRVVAVNLDQKQPGFPEHVLPDYLATFGVPFRVIEQDTYRVVKRVVAEGKTMCGLCSRLRRGALYRVAREHGMTKIALGHHRDDIVATFFLNLFFGGRLKAMPPKLRPTTAGTWSSGRSPIAPKRDIAAYAAVHAFPLIPCTLCGSQPNLQRVAIKRMLHSWAKDSPGRIETIFRGLQHAVPRTCSIPVCSTSPGSAPSRGPRQRVALAGIV